MPSVNYLQSIFLKRLITNTCSTPHQDDLFETTENYSLDVVASKRYLSIVMSLMYIASDVFSLKIRLFYCDGLGETAVNCSCTVTVMQVLGLAYMVMVEVI